MVCLDSFAVSYLLSMWCQ